MRSIAILDLECSGLDPEKDRIVEIACVVWQGTTISSFSTLIAGDRNEAERVNGIPVSALASEQAMPIDHALFYMERLLTGVDLIAAHFGDFDRSFLRKCPLPANHDSCFLPAGRRPWLMTEFMPWPKSAEGESLVKVALAHGVPVVQAHRALADCQLLASLFERIVGMPELAIPLEGADGAGYLEWMIDRALRPRVTVQSFQKFQDNSVAKAHGFRFRADEHGKRWLRTIAEDDLPELLAAVPFRVAVRP